MKNSFWIIIPFLIALLCSYSFTISKNHSTEKMIDKQGFAVIELFTSEGCSSCPPAEETVAEIQNSYRVKNVLVLSYHVDYWDNSGWKDPYSSADFTQRQQYYAGIFNLNSIYTPQAVVNGKKEFVGSERDKLISETDKALQETAEETIQLNAKETSAGKIDITYSATRKLSADEQVLLLLIQKTASGKIKRGENEGKILQHINIVRDIIYSALPAKTNALLLPAGLKKEDFFSAALLQNKTSGKIYGLVISPVN